MLGRIHSHPGAACGPQAVGWTPLHPIIPGLMPYGFSFFTPSSILRIFISLNEYLRIYCVPTILYLQTDPSPTSLTFFFRKHCFANVTTFTKTFDACSWKLKLLNLSSLALTLLFISLFFSFLKITLLFLRFYSLILEREKATLIRCSTYFCIHWLLLVCALTWYQTTLVYWDNILTNWATWTRPKNNFIYFF